MKPSLASWLLCNHKCRFHTSRSWLCVYFFMTRIYCFVYMYLFIKFSSVNRIHAYSPLRISYQHIVLRYFRTYECHLLFIIIERNIIQNLLYKLKSVYTALEILTVRLISATVQTKRGVHNIIHCILWILTPKNRQYLLRNSIYKKKKENVYLLETLHHF